MPDHQVSLNCPYCGSRLVFVENHGDDVVFACPTHRTLILPPSGRLRYETLDEFTKRVGEPPKFDS